MRTLVLCERNNKTGSPNPSHVPLRSIPARHPYMYLVHIYIAYAYPCLFSIASPIPSTSKHHVRENETNSCCEAVETYLKSCPLSLMRPGAYTVYTRVLDNTNCRLISLSKRHLARSLILIVPYIATLTPTFVV
jgi:hypothetical protein